MPFSSFSQSLSVCSGELGREHTRSAVLQQVIHARHASKVAWCVVERVFVAVVDVVAVRDVSVFGFPYFLVESPDASCSVCTSGGEVDPV
jgi:hypothetical protein